MTACSYIFILSQYTTGCATVSLVSSAGPRCPVQPHGTHHLASLADAHAPLPAPPVPAPLMAPVVPRIPTKSAGSLSTCTRKRVSRRIKPCESYESALTPCPSQLTIDQGVPILVAVLAFDTAADHPRPCKRAFETLRAELPLRLCLCWGEGLSSGWNPMTRSSGGVSRSGMRRGWDGTDAERSRGLTKVIHSRRRRRWDSRQTDESFWSPTTATTATTRRCSHGREPAASVSEAGGGDRKTRSETWKTRHGEVSQSSWVERWGLAVDRPHCERVIGVQPVIEETLRVVFFSGVGTRARRTLVHRESVDEMPSARGDTGESVARGQRLRRLHRCVALASVCAGAGAVAAGCGLIRAGSRVARVAQCKKKRHRVLVVRGDLAGGE